MGVTQGIEPYTWEYGRDHLNEYEAELRGATEAQAWSSWGRRKLLRMLSDANYGTVFLNEVTGPLVRQALGLE